MPVLTSKAVEGRVRRHYSKECSLLRKSRTFEERRICGEWYVVNANNYVVRGITDMEAEAREIGVVQPWEQVAVE